MTDKEVEEVVEKAKEKLRLFFRGMTADEKVAEFRFWPDEQIVDLCETLALETEDYEICHAAQVVKSERGIK